ncbi:hypothetical protein [Mucilaginibacter psychrotolerans]|uniref:Uncharacterized protein n=1 Tax=Mucilaginibacter psychrotolerans TaxID=1524096 RepID=A0A4Y8SP04_9SPHI|nr:hypothetical protein [Mucilaginibacter psychrotolerans]TFF40809.1 hypothetical protein E2R66_01115 [Mucilaginibacter psychrotolerans]
MTTFTVQIKDSDTELFLGMLKKFKAKVIKEPEVSPLTLEIATALRELKEMELGNMEPLSLKDI